MKTVSFVQLLNLAMLLALVGQLSAQPSVKERAPGTNAVIDKNVYSLDAFGPVGLGDIAKDSAALAAAFQIATNYGGALYIPAGVFLVTNNLVLSADKILYKTWEGYRTHAKFRIRGAGSGVSILRYAGTNSTFLDAAFPVEISDLAIRNVGGGTNTAIKTGKGAGSNSGPSSLINVTITDFDLGAEMLGGAGGFVYGCGFKGNRIGLRLPGYCDGWAVDSRIDGNTVGIELGGVADVPDYRGVKHASGARIHLTGSHNGFAVVVGKSEGTDLSGYIESCTNAVVAIGHPPALFGNDLDDYVGAVHIHNFSGMMQAPRDAPPGTFFAGVQVFAPPEVLHVSDCRLDPVEIMTNTADKSTYLFEKVQACYLVDSSGHTNFLSVNPGSIIRAGSGSFNPDPINVRYAGSTQPGPLKSTGGFAAISGQFIGDGGGLTNIHGPSRSAGISRRINFLGADGSTNQLQFADGSLTDVLDSEGHTLGAAGEAKEIWVSAHTNALGTGIILGTGAQNDPYAGDLDAIVLASRPNTIIHLLPGVFYTKGYSANRSDLRLKAHQKIIGAGVDVTFIRRDNAFYKDVQVEGELWGIGDGIEISNLTVDAAAVGNEIYKKQGISIGGSHCVVRRVKVINVTGHFEAGYEAFGISLGEPGATGGLISECEVSSVQGNYCTAIALSGHGLVELNKVIFPVPTNAAPGLFQAYQANATRNAVFRGNTVDGGTFGFYTDTFSETNLVIENNFFRNVLSGINISKRGGQWHVEGLKVLGNLVEISTNIPPGRTMFVQAIAILEREMAGTNLYKDILIQGNTVRYYGGGGISSQAATFALVTGNLSTNFDNVRIVRNSFDSSFACDLRARDYSFVDNTDLRGAPLRLRQIGPVAPPTVLLSPEDGTVLVSAAGTFGVVLPSSSGLAGKHVIVVNQKLNGDLRVSAPAGEGLAPGSPAIIHPYQVARFRADGFGSWVKQ
jgi:hypothetical protein